MNIKYLFLPTGIEGLEYRIGVISWEQNLKFLIVGNGHIYDNKLILTWKFHVLAVTL